MNANIKSKTGHVVYPLFSDANKAQVRSVSYYAHRQHDTVTWKHCGDEGQTCQCDGTVRYGAHERCDIERNTNFDGSDIHWIGNVMSAEDCALECVKYQGCDSWTWGKTPGQWFYNICFLKSGRPSASYHGGCDSGLKNACSKPTGKWSSPTPVRGQISCSTNSFHGDPYPYVPKICECSSLEWEFLGSGACVSKENHIYRRQVLVAGQYGFSSGKESCKQLCAKYPGCVGINYVNVHDHCHINLGDGTTIAGLGWNIHTGSGTGPIHHTVWMGTWECHRIVNNF